jgi:signal transduction histidine kinase
MRSQLQASRLELVDWATGLEKRVAERTHELEALYQVNYEISSRLDVQHVLQTVTEKARDLLGAEVATLCMVDEKSQVLRLTASSGPEAAIAGQESGSLAGETRRLLLSSRAQLRSGSCRGGCGILAEQYRSSHLAASLKVGEHVIGALCVSSSKTGQFGGPAADLLTRLANSAAIALENARLYAQAERVATLEERQRIAADIHDGLGQTLSYLGLVIDQASDQIESGELRRSAAYLEDARQRVGQAIAQTRQAIASLIAAETAQQSLPAQLRQLVIEFSSADQESELPAELHFEQTGGELFRMDPAAANQVWHICREALINARQHAHASHITVSLDAQEDSAALTVRDDGCGFDLDRLPEDSRQHFGLRVMRARAEQLQGDLDISSYPGQGTRVCLRWSSPHHILRAMHATDTRVAG